MASLTLLPKELFVEIICYIDIKDLLSLRIVTKDVITLLNDTYLWYRYTLGMPNLIFQKMVYNIAKNCCYPLYSLFIKNEQKIGHNIDVNTARQSYHHYIEKKDQQGSAISYNHCAKHGVKLKSSNYALQYLAINIIKLKQINQINYLHDIIYDHARTSKSLFTRIVNILPLSDYFWLLDTKTLDLACNIDENLYLKLTKIRYELIKAVLILSFKRQDLFDLCVSLYNNFSDNLIHKLSAFSNYNLVEKLEIFDKIGRLIFFGHLNDKTLLMKFLYIKPYHYLTNSCNLLEPEEFLELSKKYINNENKRMKLLTQSINIARKTGYTYFANKLLVVLDSSQIDVK